MKTRLCDPLPYCVTWHDSEGRKHRQHQEPQDKTREMFYERFSFHSASHGASAMKMRYPIEARAKKIAAWSARPANSA